MRFLDGAHCSATPQVQVRSDQSGSSAGYGTCRIVRGALAQNPRRSPEMRRTSTQAPSEKAEATSMQLRSILKACSAPADMALPDGKSGVLGKGVSVRCRTRVWPQA